MTASVSKVLPTTAAQIASHYDADAGRHEQQRQMAQQLVGARFDGLVQPRVGDERHEQQQHAGDGTGHRQPGEEYEPLSQALEYE